MFEKLRVMSATVKLRLWKIFVVEPTLSIRMLRSATPSAERRKWYELLDRVYEIVLGLCQDFAPLSTSTTLKISHELLRSGFKKL